jgi:hypothetical protein
MMNNDKKYGNDNYWCFLPVGWTGKEVAIWKGPSGQEEIIARAKDKYEAKVIIDALLKYINPNAGDLSKKELVFLEFVMAQCVEPYATMASNAILWKDHATYEDLKNTFSQIYQ